MSNLSDRRKRPPVIRYDVYFRRPDDAVVYATPPAPRETSLLHRGGDGRWHCALCDSTDCRHTEAADRAAPRHSLEPA